MPRWERVLLLAVLLIGGLGAAMVASLALAAFTYVIGSMVGADEEVDPSTQPLEIVVDAAEKACFLNVEAVAPGRHEVVVVANDAASAVVIRDPSGKVVLRQAESGQDDVAEARLLRLRLGTYEVECRTSSETLGTRFRVVPASELE